MTEEIKAVHLEHNNKRKPCPAERFGYENAKKVNAFHKSFPEYSMTPLADLSNLADFLGLKGLYVKDESYRFGLNAFKVLGGSFAIGNYIAGTLGLDISELPYNEMTSSRVKEKLGDLTFVTATDGNHGRGVAWTANRLGKKSVVYMPKGSAAERLANIRALGSDASITEFNYDDAVRLAKRNAEEFGWVMIQDTAWDGYEDIPTWIMQGYTTMAYEAIHQLYDRIPTHIFLQAGVGSMAGAVAAFFADIFGEKRPIVTIVEPTKADCIFKTAKADDGELHCVTGHMDSMMAGLCCGKPCTIGWEVLRDYADNFVSVPDSVSAYGMRILGNPIAGDPRIISGESGAVTAGLVAAIMKNKELAWLKEQIQLDENSRVLCFSTEGDTDKENYRKTVWGDI